MGVRGMVSRRGAVGKDRVRMWGYERGRGNGQYFDVRVAQM